MARKGKQLSRKRKAQLPDENEKQNEMILEEVLSISGKTLEKADESFPARLKRSANKSNEITPTQPKKLNAKKRSASPSPSSPSKQRKTNDKEEANTVNQVKVPVGERGDPVPHLPDGWRRQVQIRKSGKSAGQVDIYFYSPDGIKLRSRPEVSSYLRNNDIDLDINGFDFSRALKIKKKSRKNKSSPKNSTVPKKKTKTIQEEKSEVKAESKDSSKNKSTKISKDSEKSSAEVPPPDEAEEKNDADGKTNKDFPEAMNDSMEINGKYTQVSRNKNHMPEDEKQDEVEVSSKMLVNADENSSTRLKRSANKSNEMTSPEPKKISRKKSDKGKEADIFFNLERGDPVPNLPDGWRRQVVVRKTGVGKSDIYFYSPDGVKCRSRNDVLTYLTNNEIDLDINEFDFSKPPKTTKAVETNKSSSENSTVPKKKNKTVKEEKSEAGEESKDSSKNKISKSEKLSAEVSLPDETEEKNDADGKTDKILRNILESKPKKSKRSNI